MQPCTNEKCDNKQATPVLIHGSVVFYICESCRKKFTVGDQGFATQKEIEQLQEDYCIQKMETGKYKPVELKSILSGMGFKSKGDSIKLYNPMRDRFGPGVKRRVG